MSEHGRCRHGNLTKLNSVTNKNRNYEQRSCLKTKISERFGHGVTQQRRSGRVSTCGCKSQKPPGRSPGTEPELSSEPRGRPPERERARSSHSQHLQNPRTRDQRPEGAVSGWGFNTSLIPVL